MMENQNKDLGNYTFKVLEKDGTWGSWTGSFKTLKKAMDWYNEHGKFHENRGHKLGFFYKGSLVNEKKWKN